MMPKKKMSGGMMNKPMGYKTGGLVLNLNKIEKNLKKILKKQEVKKV